MRTIELVTIDGKSIYQGTHHSLNEAIESAIIKNISLDEIDLSNTILHHINLDGVTLRNASFRGTDLTGANMSESNFTGCDFSSANLENACLCYSNINDCNFRSSAFKDTDIAMSSLENCSFEGFSAFNLRLHTAFKIHHLTYTHFGKLIRSTHQRHSFSQAKNRSPSSAMPLFSKTSPILLNIRMRKKYTLIQSSQKYNPWLISQNHMSALNELLPSCMS